MVQIMEVITFGGTTAPNHVHPALEQIPTCHQDTAEKVSLRGANAHYEQNRF